MRVTVQYMEIVPYLRHLRGNQTPTICNGMVEDWEQGYFIPKIIYTLLLECCLATCTWLVDSKKFEIINFLFFVDFVKTKKIYNI